MSQANAAPIFWYGGQLIQSSQLPLPIDHPGLLYGASVFTTLRVYESGLEHPLTNWRGHCDRLHCSQAALGWRSPPWERLQAGAEAMAALHPVLRITLFPDGQEWIIGRPLPPQLATWQETGITAWVEDRPDLRRSLPAHKTGNYLPAWLARQAAQDQGTQEAILLNAAGEWAETATGNLWGWGNGQWWTPPVTAGILPGLMRSQLISWLRWQNKEIREAAWTADVVSTFEAIAYSNSVVQVVPMRTILNSSYGSPLHLNPQHPALEHLRLLFMPSSTQTS